MSLAHVGAPKVLPASPASPPHRRHRIRALAIVIATFATLIAAFGWWTVSTQGGARWAFEQLGAAFPGDLQIGTMRGPIRGPLEIRGLLYRNERAELLVDRVTIDWRLGALALHRLDVRSFEAEGVHLKLFAHDVPLPKDSTIAELPDVDLPLDVMLRRARVRDIAITMAGADSAITIDEVNLVDGAFRDTVTIGALTVTSPRADLELRGRGRTRGRYAADLDLAWTYRPVVGATLRGKGRVVGNLDTLRVIQSVSEPYLVRFEGAAFHPLRDLTFQGVLAFAGIPARAIDPTWPEASATGRLDLRGNLERFVTAGDVDAVTTDWGRWHAVVDAVRDTNSVVLRSVVLTIPGRATRIEARGTIVAGPAPRVDVTADWRAVAWPPRGPTTVQSSAGSARIAGPIASYRLTAEGALATPTMPAGRWRLRGDGNPHALELRSIDGSAFGGKVSGSGHVDWTRDVSWRMAFAARGLDPRVAVAGLPGSVGFDLRTHGTATRAGARGEIAVDSLSGAVRGLPVRGAGSGSYAPGSYAISALNLGWGPNLLVMTGDVGREWNLAWNVDAPDLTRTVPDGGGALQLEGSVTGARARPHVVSTLRADSLRWQGSQVKNAVGDADLDLGRGGTIRVKLDATRFQLAGRQFDHASLTGNGTREDHAIEFRIASDQDSVTIGARGGTSGDGWRGRLVQLDLASHDFGAWSLEHDAPLAADFSTASLGDFCWRSGTGRWCAEAVWHRDGPWDVRSRLENVPLALLEPALPPAIGLTGPMSGTLDAHGFGERVSGDADLTLGPGDMSYPTGKKTGVTHLDPSTLRVHADGVSIDTKILLALSGTDTVRASMRTPQALDAQGRVLAGALHARIQDMGFVQAFVPELTQTSGQLRADLALTGTTSAPRWSGRADLTAGAADLPHLAVQLRDVTFAAASDANGRLEFHGGARSGPGHLDLEGDATVAAGGIHRARATLKGDRFQVIDTRDAHVLVSPDLTAKLEGDSVGLSGEVLVPEADVHPKPISQPAVRPSPDVVMVDTLATETPGARTLRTYAEVRLTLGNSVRVRASGLDAKLQGSILAIDRPDLPPTGSGELTLEQGTYNAYGRKLTIDRGRLIFAGGPIGNPGLDVRASRHASDGVVAGFEVMGTLLAPNLTVFSEPAMAQRDALAYVILGHRLDKSSQSQQGLVNEAANTLGLSGGNYVAGTLARRFGIDEASIQSEGAFQNASLILGTYLSPRVYVNYGVGILDPVSTLRIQYFLTNQWTLQTETGSDNRADVLYTVEH